MRKVIGNKRAGHWLLRIFNVYYYLLFSGWLNKWSWTLRKKKGGEMPMECSVWAWYCCCFSASLSPLCLSLHKVYPVRFGPAKKPPAVCVPQTESHSSSVWASFLLFSSIKPTRHIFSILYSTQLVVCFFLHSFISHQPFYSQSFLFDFWFPRNTNMVKIIFCCCWNTDCSFHVSLSEFSWIF